MTWYFGNDSLQISGKNPNENKEKSIEIHEAICPRWQNAPSSGLSDTERSTLSEKYVFPSNLDSSSSETNKELAQIVNLIVEKKDACYEAIQNQLRHSLLALSQGISSISEDTE
ncbi:hypothetical protein HHI36_014773 [Cryptolaemus montrouzieri]|uniref:Uncharacterized protein n=1 Tax=Cryptolaemus montrouzieri TaxID=559131 RepID=A0ABD2N3X5_9CUCU